MTSYAYYWMSFTIKAADLSIIWVDINGTEHRAKDVKELQEQLENL